jgi:glutaredoxin
MDKAVVLFTMKSCPFCVELKEMLNKSNIQFVDRDIDEYEEEYNMFVNITENDYVPAFMLIEDPETGYSHWLGHLDSRTVDEGEFVTAGTKVGTLGDSGNAKGTAPHLHYNIYKTSSGFYSGENPLDVLKGAIDKKGKSVKDREYESMGDKFKKAFKKLFGDEEKNEKGEVKVKDEEDLWDKMKKVGSTFFDKLGDLFN